MAIELVFPPTPHVPPWQIGPGAFIGFLSSVPDQPRPLPDFWDIDIRDNEQTQSIWHNQTPGDGFGRFTWQIGATKDDPVHNFERKVILPTGVNAFVTVRWISNTGADHDVPFTGAIPWNATDGAWQLPAATTVTGGFTDTDRQTLVTTQTNTTVNMAVSDGVPTQVPIGLAEFFGVPPNHFLSRGELILVSGRGSLFRPPGGPAVRAYGAFIQAQPLPPQLGRQLGVPDELQERLIQFSVVRTDFSSLEYFAVINEVSMLGQEFVWGVPAPVRIDFDVLPGVVIEWTWLLLPLQ